jgi:hypothetical protein
MPRFSVIITLIAAQSSDLGVKRFLLHKKGKAALNAECPSSSLTLRPLRALVQDAPLAYVYEKETGMHLELGRFEGRDN